MPLLSGMPEAETPMYQAAQVAGEAANRKTSGLKTLRGGATGKRFHLGPCMAKASYSTVRNGWADAIQAGAGMKTKKQHGGEREGAGRPKSPHPRCPCGRYTLASALAMRHKCATVSA